MSISRRTLIAAAAAIPLTVDGGCAAARVGALYVTPTGGGDGGSWDAGASLSNLDELLARLRPGGEILIAADRGAYEVRSVIELTRGGRGAGAVRVRGVNSETGEPMHAVLQGDRADSEGGSEGFRLLRGANRLHFSHLDFRGLGNGCFRIGGAVRWLTIEDCRYANVYRFIENTTSNGQSRADLRDFAIRRCSGVDTERGFLRIRYASRDGLIEDCRAEGRANEGGDIPAGCALDDRAQNITYRRCVMENFQQWRAGDYWNGDGFSDEEQNQGIRYEACEARGATDGGFDCKSRGVVFEGCIAEDNKRNFRIWSAEADMRDCISRTPNFRGRAVENADSSHIWIGGDGARIRINGLTIEDQNATQVFEFDAEDARVEVSDVSIAAPRENWGDLDDATVVFAER